MLPDADGFEICKYMKRKKNLSHIPIVMLTAKSEEADTILGLELALMITSGSLSLPTS